MEIKKLYQFEVNQEVEEEKVWKEQEANGETVTRTKKVKVTKPIQFVLSKPKRKDINRCDEQRKISLGKYIRAQYITKAELQHQYEKFGIEKEFGEKWVNSLKEYSDVSQKLKGEPKNKEELESQLSELQNTISQIESRYREIFDSTAETASETDTILSLMLFCTYIKNGEKQEIYFKGSDFDAKRDFLDELDDQEDEIFQLVYSRLLTLWTAWFYGNKDEKSLGEIDRKISKQIEESEEIKEEEPEETSKESKGEEPEEG